MMMRRKINGSLGWTFLPSPTRGHGLPVGVLFYLIVVLPNHICESHRQQNTVEKTKSPSVAMPLSLKRWDVHEDLALTYEVET